METRRDVKGPLALFGRYLIEHYQIGDKRLFEVFEENLFAGGGNDIDVALKQEEIVVMGLSSMIASDVNGYNDGNLSKIAVAKALPNLCGFFGFSETITPDHPLVNLVQTVRDAMHREFFRLHNEQAPAPTIKIDAAAISAKAAGRVRA